MFSCSERAALVGSIPIARFTVQPSLANASQGCVFPNGAPESLHFPSVSCGIACRCNSDCELTAGDLAGSYSYYEPRLESEIERVQEVVPTVAMTIARDLSLISDEGLSPLRKSLEGVLIPR